MRTSLIALAAVSLASLAAPAFADDAAAAPASPFTVTGGATLTSDYRFRGISQTNKRFAIQGTFGVSHESGLYVGTWGSSIDDYVAGGSDQEIDLYAGYKHTWAGTAVDMGVLYYYYPGSGGGNTDFFEPYINASHSFGPIGVKVGGNFSWKQKALAYTSAKTLVSHSKGDGFYGYGELSAAIPNTGLTVTGHLGHSFERNYITFGTQYTDWSVTAAYTWKALTFSAAYVDTTGKKNSFLTGTGRNPVKAGFVGSVGVAF
jgi:uncharacterized protein (TIGR02001 family)